ncbi:MAG: hypothetical protein QOF78_3908, partial [Phycisphaerales bacterium]|nr:hypothetical protein [Phycisphaerales bacterium]
MSVVTRPIQPASAAAPASVAPSAVLDLWTRRATHWLALLAVTAIVFYLCWMILAPFADVLMWAAILTIVFRPLHRKILARLGSPGAAAGISCVLVIVMILLPVTLVTMMIARDAAAMAQQLQANKDRLLDPDANTPLGRTLRHVDRYVDIDRVASQEYLASRMRELSGVVARGTLNLVGGLVGAIVEIFFVIFTMYYLFRDGERLWAAARDVIPLSRAETRQVVARTKDVIYASVYGSVMIAIVQGTLGGIAFWALGVPSPLLWGAVMTLFCMIPMAGSFLVWVPAAIYLLAVGHPMKALALTLWGALVISTIDNILRPKLVGERTHMHELIIFFSVLGGLQVFGMIGLVA